MTVRIAEGVPLDLRSRGVASRLGIGGPGRAAVVCTAVVCTAVISLLPPSAAAATPADPATRVATRLELVSSTVDGAGLERLSAARCTWRGADGRRIDVPTDSVVAWGRCPPWPQGPMVLLVGGGVIAGEIESLDEASAVVRSTSLGRLTVPTAAVAGYRRSVARGPAGAVPPDAAVGIDLANGDRLEPRRIAVRDGRAVIDNAEAAGLDAAGATQVTVPMAVVAGIDFPLPAPAEGGPSHEPSPRLLVAIDDGSRFPVAAVSMPAAGPPASAEVVLLAAGRPVACGCDRDAIVAVAVDGGGVRFLASLEPEAFEHTPAFGRPWPLARDRTLSGGWPSARGVTAFSGLGIHGPARVRYRIDPAAGRFESLVAIDDSTGQGGAAIVRVRARDGDGAWEDVFVSGVLRGADEPVAVRAALRAATAIELVVEPAPPEGGGLPGGILDRTIWLDPRVVAER
jgi:hypothetical protein